MRVTALVLSQRRIRRYFVLPLKAAGKQRDFSHVRFTISKQEASRLLGEDAEERQVRQMTMQRRSTEQLKRSQRKIER